MKRRVDIEASMPFTPVLIVGAGRSGTNALRDALSSLHDFETWPCDEIDAIWRYGNLMVDNDEFGIERATPRVRKYIRNAFLRLYKKTGKPQFIVEKTCANSLRIPFVEAILPDAKYIHIIRDGGDVIASATKRWSGKMEIPSLPYYFAKLRYVPASSLPTYFWKFVKNRFLLYLGKEKRFSVWGPRFRGLNDMDGAPVEELCAHQWMACMSASLSAFSKLEHERVFFLRYEDFVSDPANKLHEILMFLGQERPMDQIVRSVSGIRRSSVGKGEKIIGGLSSKTSRQISEINNRISLLDFS